MRVPLANLHAGCILLGVPHRGLPCVTTMSVTILISVAQSISQVEAVCVWSGDSVLDYTKHHENQQDERGGTGNTCLRLVSCHRSGTWPAFAGVYIIAALPISIQETPVRTCSPQEQFLESITA